MDSDSDSISVAKPKFVWQFDLITTPPRQIRWIHVKCEPFYQWTWQQKQCLDYLGFHFKWNKYLKRQVPDRKHYKRILGASFEQRDQEMTEWKDELEPHKKVQSQVVSFLKSSYRQFKMGTSFEVENLKHFQKLVLEKRGFALLTQALTTLKDLTVQEYKLLNQQKIALDFFDAFTDWCRQSNQKQLLRFVPD